MSAKVNAESPAFKKPIANADPPLKAYDPAYLERKAQVGGDRPLQVARDVCPRIHQVDLCQDADGARAFAERAAPVIGWTGRRDGRASGGMD